MQTSKINIQDIHPAEYNPRIMPEEEYNKLKNSLDTFGLVDPIIIDLKHDNTIIGGHQRYQVLMDNNDEQELTLIKLGDIGLIIKEENIKLHDINNQKALNLALNKISGEWDYQKLDDILIELSNDDYMIELTGFDTSDILLNLDDDKLNLNNLNESPSPLGELMGATYSTESGNLVERYIVPPFSILDTTQGYWQTRKKQWWTIFIDNGQSREKKLDEKMGISIFDPTLADVLTSWFVPKNKGNNIVDPFSGSTTIGFVSSYKKNNFTGIELREEQCTINNTQIQQFPQSKYICDDGQNILKHVQKESQDLLISCPPYFNLEIYSDLPNDASNQENYDDFYKILDNAYTDSIQTLKNNRFAIIIVGNVRGKDGFYHTITNDIINTFQKNNMYLYNWLILKNATGSASLRAKRYMSTRKMVKTHQDILIFYKGDLNKLKDEFPKEPLHPVILPKVG